MRYGAHGSGGTQPDECDKGTSTPVELFNACLDPYVYKGNLHIADHFGPEKWPAGNNFAKDTDAVGFVADGTYALAPTSPYKGTGLDGKDPGADIPLLLQMIDGVRVAPVNLAEPH